MQGGREGERASFCSRRRHESGLASGPLARGQLRVAAPRRRGSRAQWLRLCTRGSMRVTRRQRALRARRARKGCPIMNTEPFRGKAG